MIEALAVLVGGLLAGSFLNVCIYRMPRDQSVVWPGSRCPRCGRPIPWHDNIPVFSFLFLGGRCRFCRSAIPWRYPIVEAATGALFVAAWLRFPAALESAKWACFAAIMLALAVADLETRILPDEFTLGGLVPGFVFAWLSPMEGPLGWLLVPQGSPRMASLTEAALTAVLASGGLWLAGWAYHRLRGRQGLGLGDVKMAAVLGAFLGLQDTLLAFLIGCASGAILGLLYIVVRKKDASTYELPFGTFLGLSSIAVAFLPF